MRGPARVDSKVVNHGEWLNHDSNHPCCCVRSRLRLARPSLTFSIDSQTIPEQSVKKKHSSFKAAHNPPCFKKIKSSPLLF